MNPKNVGISLIALSAVLHSITPPHHEPGALPPDDEGARLPQAPIVVSTITATASAMALIGTGLILASGSWIKRPD